MLHSLYIGDERYEYAPDMFDVNLTTGEVIAKIAQSVIDGEKDGDKLVIMVLTHKGKVNS
jgi:hypothetical protein